MQSPFYNSTKHKIQIYLITHYPVILKSLQVLIEDNRDMCVSAASFNLESIPSFNDLAHIDIVLIYLADGNLSTIEIIPQLLQLVAGIKVVVVASSADVINQARAIQLGAVGIVQKEQNSRILIEAIRQVYKGDTWINQALLAKLLRASEPKKKSKTSNGDLKAQSMTTREKEVIQLIGKGLKNKKIAETLHISEATVRHHLSSIYSKTGVEDRLSLVIYAYQRSLITFSNEKNINGNSIIKSFIY